ncbi:DUF4321 domain-containing protein [uncultured Ruminococcus sp.]|uniref:DUF4321 domain-containing protein n=1 Tax=uncultured Ruminococcus sp. TaxID=165186 RepID=UPI000EBE690D|nr:DUF4321 domain-containing protein [uncultured Ruminococcus sp.]HCJ41186.1 DUF4321 domain-containing protein [Ruminococcus sp.]
MESFKKGFAFIFFMLAGIVLGAFLAIVCEGKPYVDWLSWGKDIGVQDLSVDLYVIKFTLGLMVHATISQIVTILAALIAFAKVGKNI